LKLGAGQTWSSLFNLEQSLCETQSNLLHQVFSFALSGLNTDF